MDIIDNFRCQTQCIFRVKAFISSLKCINDTIDVITSEVIIQEEKEMSKIHVDN